MSNDVFSNREIDELRNECYEGISMDEKSGSMFDMDIVNSSFFGQIEGKPRGWCKSDMRDNMSGIPSRDSIKNLPKILSPKTGKGTVLYDFDYRKIYSSCESHHLNWKALLKYLSILLNSTRMIESIWGDLEYTRHCVL